MKGAMRTIMSCDQEIVRCGTALYKLGVDWPVIKLEPNP